MNRKIAATALIVSLMSYIPTFAASNFSYTQNTPQVNNSYVQPAMTYDNNKPLQGYVVVVPAGTDISATLMTPLSSETASIGQVVSMVLGSDFKHNGKLIAPQGSTVTGSVIEVSKAKHGSMNGKLCVRFNQIVTPYGTQIPISAVIKTEDGTGDLVGGTKMDVTKDYAKDLAVGSAVGAGTGAIIGHKMDQKAAALKIRLV